MYKFHEDVMKWQAYFTWGINECYPVTFIYLPIGVQSVSMSCTLSCRAVLSFVNIDALKSRTSFKDVNLILPAVFFSVLFGQNLVKMFAHGDSDRSWVPWKMAQGRPCFSDGSKSQDIYARSVKPCGCLKRRTCSSPWPTAFTSTVSSHTTQPPSVETFCRVYDRKKEHRWCKPLKYSAKDSSQDPRIFGASLCDVKYLAPCYKRWCSWLRHCATSRKVASSIPDGSLGFFIGIILPAAISLQQH